VHTIIVDGGFEWDEVKAASNLQKHDVAFADAVAVFSDDRALITGPFLAMDGERRFVALGTDLAGRVLVVAYTWRETRIRIISARRALPRERKEYRTKSSS
jgi:uncharacterized DUF497 family protein